MRNGLSILVAALVTFSTTAMATSLEDIREDQAVICQHLRHLHPTLAPLALAIGNQRNIVAECHTEGDEAYAPKVLVFRTAAGILHYIDHDPARAEDD